MTKVTLVKIPKLAARLSAAVRRRKTNQSAIISEALEGHLRSDAPDHNGTFLDLAGDIVGSVAGPADLSTRKRPLRGYGR